MAHNAAFYFSPRAKSLQTSTRNLPEGRITALHSRCLSASARTTLVIRASQNPAPGSQPMQPRALCLWQMKQFQKSLLKASITQSSVYVTAFKRNSTPRSLIIPGVFKHIHNTKNAHIYFNRTLPTSLYAVSSLIFFLFSYESLRDLNF